MALKKFLLALWTISAVTYLANAYPVKMSPPYGRTEHLLQDMSSIDTALGELRKRARYTLACERSEAFSIYLRDLAPLRQFYRRRMERAREDFSRTIHATIENNPPVSIIRTENTQKVLILLSKDTLL